jgi:hypothetical protein
MRSRWLLWTSIVIFITFFVGSIWKQSPLLLYIASAMPIFVVLFMPDIRGVQKLKLHQKGVDIVKLAGAAGEPEWLVVSFRPGTIYWHRKTLHIPLESVETVQTVNSDEYTAALTVLSYDVLPRKKSGYIRIALGHLAARTAGMPFTVNEVNRLLIPLVDVAQADTTEAPTAVASQQMKLHA